MEHKKCAARLRTLGDDTHGMHSPHLVFSSFSVNRVNVAARVSTRMDHKPRTLRRAAIAAVLPTLLLLFSSGCRDSSVKTYRIAKEREVPAGHASGAEAGSSGMNGTGVASKSMGADLAWTAPAHWKSKAASSMRKGSYAVEANGASADLSITAFPGDVGGEIANVNRWRRQIQLEPIADQEIANAITRFEANALTISYVDLVNGSQRMLAAFVPFDGATWFFKLTGPDAIVGPEKEAFVSFLRTVKPSVAQVSSPHENMASGVIPARPQPEMASSGMDDLTVKKSEGPDLQWTAPATWQVGAPNAMRKGSYRIAGEADAVAEISITAFPGDVGGEIANVNRWRNQLGLPAAPAAEISNALTHREQAGLRISIVEIPSPAGPQAQRLIGAMVPFGEATWFFKLTGPDAVVAREKPAFLAFLETIHAP